MKRGFLTIALLLAGLYTSAIAQQFYVVGTVPAAGVNLNFAATTSTGCSSVTSCLSITRSGSETCEPLNGTVTYASTNTACITSEGLQVFQGGTNIVPQSQATTGWQSPSNATWAAGSSGTAPDGVADALVLTDNSTNGAHAVGSALITPSSGTVYTVTAFVKAGACGGGTCTGTENATGSLYNFPISGTEVGIQFNASTCTVQTGFHQLIKVLPPKPLANGWCKVGYIVKATSSSPTTLKVAMAAGLASYNEMAPSYVGTVSTMLFWGFDIKAGSVELPYVPTAGASASSNSDVITDGGSDTTLKTYLEGSALRVVAQTAEFSEGQPDFATCSPCGPAAQTLLGVGSSLTALGVSNPGGATPTGYALWSNWPTTATLTTKGQILRYANTNYLGISADASGRSVALNGQTAVSDSNGLSPTSTEYIGSVSGSSAFCNCVIAQLSVWNTRSDTAMKTATANPNVLPLVTAYTGIVANHTRPNYVTAASPIMSRSHHRATENITALSLVLGNYSVTPSSSGEEIVPAGTTSMKASVEYPQGTCQAFTFSSSSSGSTTGGQLTTDLITLTNAIPSGADFWVRVYRSNSSSSALPVNDAFSGLVDTNAGDAMNTSSATDQTVSCGTVTDTSAAVGYYPDAIVGTTQLHAYCIIGDSRSFGAYDQPNDSMDSMGLIERALLPYYSVENISVFGEYATYYVNSGNHTYRNALLPYCTGIINNLGGNDTWNTNIAAATVEAAINTIAGYNTSLNGGGGPVWDATMNPTTTSNNDWTNLAGQTAKAGAASAITVNDWMRTNPTGFVGYFEQAGLSSSFDSYYWATNGVAFGWTFDGGHFSVNGYNYQANSIGFQVLQ
jgi:hypothetical protein